MTIIQFPNQASATATTKINPFSVRVQWSESREFSENELIDFAEFERRALNVALSNVNNGCDKTSVVVTFDNGFEYKAQLDLATKQDLNFAHHCRNIARTYIESNGEWFGDAAEQIAKMNLVCDFDQLETAEQQAIDTATAKEMAEAKAAKEKRDRDFAAAVERYKSDPDFAHLAQIGSSGATEVAKNFRKDLKHNFPGVKFSVRCERGGWSSSIRVSYVDGPALEDVKTVINRYKAGNFNGMTDCYDHERSPFTKVFGSADYIWVSRDYSDEATQHAIDLIVEEYGNEDGHDLSVENFNKGGLYYVSPISGAVGGGNSWQAKISEKLSQLDFTKPSQTKAKAEPKAPAAEAAPTCEQLTLDLSNIDTTEPQQTTHAKKGHDLFVVQLSARVSKEIFLHVCDIAKSHGGYYSKYNKEGAIPGYQFTSLNEAQLFRSALTVKAKQASQAPAKPKFKAQLLADGWHVVIDIAGIVYQFNKIIADDMRGACAIAWQQLNKPTDPTPTKKKAPAKPAPKNHAAKLRPLAARLIEKGNEELNADRLENTAKRASQAATARERAREMIANGETLQAIATAQEADTAGPLSVICNKKQLETLNTVNSVVIPADYRGPEHYNGYRIERQLLKDGVTIADYIDQITYPNHYRAELVKLGVNDLAQLKAMLTALDQIKAAPAQECPIKTAERQLIGVKIPGFFPTPEPVRNILLDAADMRPGLTVLEPSAGSGDLADAILNAGGVVSCCEIAPELRELLHAKGHAVISKDILTVNSGSYDRVIMNPPFEKGQDCDHVRHCFELLKPGGVLVSVMSASIEFRTDKKYTNFRQWLENNGGYIEPLPANSFNTGPRATGVNTVMIVISK